VDDIRVETSIDRGIGTLRIVGEIDAATASTLDERLRRIEAEPGVTVVELDFSDVEFIDSSGLSVLVAAHKRAKARDIALVLTNPTPATRRVFTIAGIDEVITIR